MKKTIFLGVVYLLCLLTWNRALAQQELHNKDKHNLLYYFKNGKWNGHFRNYLMATDNGRKELTDYYANAIAADVHYETAQWKGLHAGFGTSFVYNTASSDLGKPDAVTGQFNRYEIGLFDLAKPYQALIGTIDELFISYAWGKSEITWGKQKLVTPWLNPQDGRMRPNFQEGLYIDFQEVKNLRIELAWIYRFLVRSTEIWPTIANSIGQYPTGVTPDGVRSSYTNNLKSAGLGILGITYAFTPQIKTQFWNYFTENIFNTMFWQTEAEIPLSKSENKNKLLAGMQFHFQTALNDGGNSNPELAYIPKNQRNWVLSSRVGWKTTQKLLTLNYTRIGNHGRFLFPREWGRDPFYTFLPRERNEGYGDVNAFMIQLGQNLPKMKTRIEIGYGHYYLPNPDNASLNKYGFPSYNQINLNLVHQCKGLLEGLQAQFLYVYKGKLGETYNNPRFEFNKVNMSLYNFILNYNF
ncbi:MAG: OprD family outer membrane porin [Microscillaceae bacterium]|nr:OprD family outer membrane porin [Microscillaceae bacterium]MDW8461428.1 OprD family outer membrane porin [Cytophagales bacterium]